MTNVRKAKVERLTRLFDVKKSELENRPGSEKSAFIEGKIEAFTEVVSTLKQEFNLSIEGEEKLPPKKQEVVDELIKRNTPRSIEAANYVRKWRNSSGGHGGWDTAYVTNFPEFSDLVDTIPIQER